MPFSTLWMYSFGTASPTIFDFELVAVAGPVRLDHQRYRSELAGAAGLLVVGVAVLDPLGYALMECHLRRAGIDVDLMDAPEDIDLTLKLVFAHSLHNCLKGLGIERDLKIRIVGTELRERNAELLLLSLRLRLGIQSVWGALLGISLQARTIELVASGAVIAYGRLATIGAATAAVVQILIGIFSDARRRKGSRRIEFYAVGAAGGAAAIAFFYEAHTFLALTVAFVALQAALNVAIGPYQAIIPDFVERARIGIASSWMAALQSAGNAIGALAASFIANAGALAAALGALLLATFALTSGHARKLPLQPGADIEEPLRVTRPFVDLFISRALVYVGFYTLLGYLLFYVEAAAGLRRPRPQRSRRRAS